MTPPPEFSALPPAGLYRASPKAISGRTSYLRVRLEFLPYPHLIATLFNGCAFGPPLPFTAASAWTWVDHPVSGLHIPTSFLFLQRLYALFTLGFPPAPVFFTLTLPVYAARRTVLQKVRGQTLAVLPQFAGTGVQVLFHSPPGVLFTFPSQYSALSVTKEYLALRGGPRSFPQGFSCLVVLWILPRSSGFHLRGFHPLWRAFPGPFCYPLLSLVQSEPRCARTPVWALPVSLAATSGIDVSFFSSGYLDVSVHRVPSVSLSGFPLLQHTAAEVCSAGFPHSDICGSLLICSSPQLFAAYHVFLRPFVPRHPPCALLCLTSLPSGSPPSSAPSVALSGSLVLGILPAPLLLQLHLRMSFLFLSVILGSRCCLSRFTNLIDLDFQYSVFKVQC